MASPDVIVRRLTPADATVWRAIRLEALQRSPEAFGQTYEHALSQPVENFAKTVSGPYPVLAAFADSTAIGTAGIYVIEGPKSAHRGMLWGMYVAPAFRGHRIGERLIDAVIAEVPTGVVQIHLRVVTENIAAYKLYRRKGFEAYGIEPRALFYDGRYFDEAMMVLRLDRHRS